MHLFPCFIFLVLEGMKKIVSVTKVLEVKWARYKKGTICVLFIGYLTNKECQKKLVEENLMKKMSLKKSQKSLSKRY